MAAALICLGYNVLYLECPLPNGQTGQLLDIMDYISNSFLMPLISFLTCIFVRWVLKPQWIQWTCLWPKEDLCGHAPVCGAGDYGGTVFTVYGIAVE